MSHRVPTVLIAAALVASGCGASNSNDKPAKSAASQAASSAAPYGLYVRTVTRQDITRTASRRDEHGPDQSTPPAGRYRLVIAKGAAQDVIKVTGPDGFTIGMDMTVRASDLHLTTY